MKICHNDAITLENIVTNAHHSHDCDGMGGFIDADHFETNPFDAALIALSPIWKTFPKETVEVFYVVGIVHYEKKMEMTQTSVSLFKSLKN